MTFRLAACAEMIYLGLPFDERVRRIADQGFEVEIWDWTDKDLVALAATGATFSSMKGYLRGDLTTRGGANELVSTAREALIAAETLEVPRLVLHGTGLGEGGLPVRPKDAVTGADWLHAADTLGRVAKLGERAGRVFQLENLNRAVDHPGVPFATTDDVLTLIQAIDSPALRVNLDLYHAQIGEGNLVELVRRMLPWTSEIQVADVPGRCEPGTGEIRFEAIADVLRDLGYSGVVALEAFAHADSDTALKSFRAAFA